MSGCFGGHRHPRVVHRAGALERQIGRNRIDQDKIAARQRGRGHAIENHHIERTLRLGRFPVRRARHLDVGKQLQQANQIRIARADVENAQRRAVGKHQIGAVVGREVVGDFQARHQLSRQRAVVGNNQHAPLVRAERDLLAR